MTRRAIEEQVDLVVAAGGDGTVRMIADGLARTGIAIGLVASGTGNLLARNPGLPLNEAEAVEVAFAGHTRAVDLVRSSADDSGPTRFAVMAGVGVDARVMDETDEQLKEKLGALAYFAAAGRTLRRLPVRVSMTVDDRAPLRRRALQCLVGNVGELPVNITLLPGARADDGLLDLYLALRAASSTG